MKQSLLILTILVSQMSLTGAEFLPRNPMALMGTVQFPSTVEQVPDVRFYRAGRIVDCEIDNKSHKILYSIMDDRSQLQFTLLITDTISFETEANTVKYIKIDPHQKYRFYVLTLKEIIDEANPDSKNNQYQWIIKETTIPFRTGRIPDNTLIMCYNPDFIDSLIGGNVVTLPTIKIKPNILALVGSEIKLHEKSIELYLSSLDYNALHGHSKQRMKSDFANKTILTLTT